VSQGQLARLVGAGALRYDGRGTYRLKTAPVRYAIAKQLRGVVSHRSAAAHWGMRLAEPLELTEITVDPRRRRVNPPPEGVKVYQRIIGADEHDGSVTSPVRTIVDCARDLDIPDALVIADAAVRSGKAELDELAAAAAKLHGRGSARARRVIGWIDATSQSVLESVTRGVLLDGGITGFVPQFPVKISTGLVFHADLGNEEARLLVEAGSMLAHTGEFRVAQDALRCTEFAAAGYTVMRFTWSNVRHRQPWVVEMVRNALKHRT
jgi:very-short-patch-repair endonuclease